MRQLHDPGIDPDHSEGLSHYSTGPLLRSQGIADQLRETRLRYGLSLSEAADQLRIRRVYLEAIEDARFGELPGAAYGSGFVRSYADFLGLDGEQAVRRFRQEAGRSAPAELIFPTLKSEAGIPGGAIVLLSLLLAGLAYGAWYLLSERDKGHVATVQQAPPQLTQLIADKGLGGTPPGAAGVAMPAAVPAPAPPPPVVAAPPPPPEEVSPQAGPIVVSQAGAILTEPPVKPAPPTAVAAAPPPSVPADSAALPAVTMAAAPAPTPSATTAQAATPPVTGPLPAELSGARVVLQARLESWVQIVGPDSNTLFTKVLRAGEFYAVPTQPAGLTLVTGNAGGLDIWLDGRRLAPLGPIGVVRRNVPLDPTKLRQDSLAAQGQQQQSQPPGQ